MSETEKLISVACAAECIGVGKSVLYAKAKAGELPCFRIGDRILFRLSELLEAMRVAPAAEELPGRRIAAVGR